MLCAPTLDLTRVVDKPQHNANQTNPCRYFDPDTVGLDFKGMIADITAAPDGSIILLHGKPVLASAM